MAGHSKWANIRFRKSVQDSKRAKIWTKYIREITVAASKGGASPQTNPRLRLALDKAFAANMTRDTVERAIKRGAGGQEGQDLEEVRYEGYGPGGVAVMVDCLTNNRNRTVSEVRHAFTKFGGNLGTDGSVAYCFKKCGQIVFGKGVNEDKVMELALDAGAEDIQTDSDGTMTVITNFSDFSSVKQSLESKGLQPERAEITYMPNTYAAIEDKDSAEKCNKLIDMLEDLDDVQAVYTNADIAEKVLAEMGYD